MSVLKTCPLCQSSAYLQDFSAKSSEFIQKRVGVTSDIKFFYCKSCSFHFFDYRYSDEEMNRLYQGYRNEDYIKMREDHQRDFDDYKVIDDEEPRYGFYGAPLNFYADTFGFLTKNLDLNTTQKILDYGGGKGELLKLFLGERFIYEINGTECLPGIKKISSRELSSHSFDLVILSHVLEHVPDFNAFLHDLSKIKSSLFFIEVPYSFDRQEDPAYVYRMSEHINYFDEISLAKALRPYFFPFKYSIDLLSFKKTKVQRYVLRTLMRPL